MASARRATMLCMGLGIAMGIICGSLTAVWAQSSLPAENPLEQHRRNAAGRGVAALSLQGMVIDVQEMGIVTDLFWKAIQDLGVNEGDRVDVRIQGRMLAARILSAESYRQLRESKGAMATMDVDVVGVPGADSALVIVGLSGDLGAFFGAGPGMPLTITKR